MQYGWSRRRVAPSPDDQPSIGIILCKSKNQIVAEYALRDTNKPMGISTYQLQDALPSQLKGNLPMVEELEDEV
uniref:PDDEXK nuclease domain-containing protein n=1 Tax=Chroococcidiopsis sp. TS-821 TaxID=1378066 RepID=UPI0021132517|nr:PDDEXK nuclease domain-containing protein [Chroococcidiopsis sp. TS-821]